MSEEVTVQEVKMKTINLHADMFELIKKYESETGMQVTDAEIFRVPSCVNSEESFNLSLKIGMKT